MIEDQETVVVLLHYGHELEGPEHIQLGVGGNSGNDRKSGKQNNIYINKHNSDAEMRVLLLFIALIIFLSNAFAEDAKFDGHAIYRLGGGEGAWGWVVYVDQVIDGPADMVGKNISVYMKSANPEDYPPGFIDPSINASDNVSVYGWLQFDHILLVGSHKYYIKRAGQEEAKHWWQFWK